MSKSITPKLMQEACNAWFPEEENARRTVTKCAYLLEELGLISIESYRRIYQKVQDTIPPCEVQ